MNLKNNISGKLSLCVQRNFEKKIFIRKLDYSMGLKTIHITKYNNNNFLDNFNALY